MTKRAAIQLVAALWALSLALSSCSDATPDSDRTAAPTPTASQEKTPKDTEQGLKRSLVLGPHGVGQLQLGMTPAQVTETRVANAVPGSRHDGWPHGCWVLQCRPERLGRTPGDTLNGSLSEQNGLERIYATRRMATPEGIRLGSSLLDVRTAYDTVEYEDGAVVDCTSARTVGAP